MQPLIVAGRTDTGVHARAQIVNLHLNEAQQTKLIGKSARAAAESLMARLNGVLPPDIQILKCQKVPESFNARFSAVKRQYKYYLADDSCIKSPIIFPYSHFVYGVLDIAAMNAAAAKLLGHHDFSTFIKKREGASNDRTLLQLQFRKTQMFPGLPCIEASITADAFAHNMVRSLMRALIQIGLHKRDSKWLIDLFKSGARMGDTGPLPAKALFLNKVTY